MYRKFKVVERSDCFVPGEVALRPTSKKFKKGGFLCKHNPKNTKTYFAYTLALLPQQAYIRDIVLITFT